VTPSKILALLVEGNDDDRFAGAILEPTLKQEYTSVVIFRYAEEPRTRVQSFIGSIVGIGGDYLLLADADTASCATQRKQDVIQRFPNVSPERVIVVTRMIEGWYFAGLPTERKGRLRSLTPSNTDNLTKSAFRRLRPRSFSSDIDFMHELLAQYSVGEARKMNASFEYGCQKHRIA
jgi:hypothetical protein